MTAPDDTPTDVAERHALRLLLVDSGVRALTAQRAAIAAVTGRRALAVGLMGEERRSVARAVLLRVMVGRAENL